MRTLEELRDVKAPAWPNLHAALAGATTPVTVLPVGVEVGGETLVALQVTAASALGALALHTGGVLVDDGWLRLLGGGEPAMNLARVNGLPGARAASAGALTVAFDVLGGRYAVNGGGLPGEQGEVCYFAPDELAWIPMEMGHGSFVAWSLTDDLARFNDHLRWTGWQDEVRPLDPDRGIAVYPYPFTSEGHDLSVVSRRPAPISELLALWDDLARQVRNQPPRRTP